MSSNETVRINKALADAGFCSRRKADEHIVNGDVLVNGQRLTTPGAHIRPREDVVTVNGETISFKSDAEGHCYLLANKPIRVLSTVRDPQGRQTVVDLIPTPWKKYRLFPVGRLDYFSEGLLLLTNDGALAYKLTRPSAHIPKVYRVLTRGNLSSDVIRKFNGGMTLKDGLKLLPAPTRVLRNGAQEDLNWLEVTLYQGVNRQIRRMFQDVDLTILKLIRERHGPLKLNNLPQGTMRPLSPEEVQRVKAVVQLK